jgi:hypothetical protein
MLLLIAGFVLIAVLIVVGVALDLVIKGPRDTMSIGVLVGGTAVAAFLIVFLATRLAIAISSN